MDNRTIQRLIAQNAIYISNLHYNIDGHTEAARDFKKMKELSFSIHQYKLADKLRIKLKPAVDTQIALKAEIRWNDHVARLNKQMGFYDMPLLDVMQISSLPYAD